MITVNGEQHPHCDTLAALLVTLAYDPLTVATAVNGVFVPIHQREISFLSEGDAIEILAPMQGG